MATNDNSTLEALVKALQLIAALRPILTSAIETEAERQGLSREEKQKLFKRLTTETDAITTEDMGDNP